MTLNFDGAMAVPFFIAGFLSALLVVFLIKKIVSDKTGSSSAGIIIAQTPQAAPVHGPMYIEEGITDEVVAVISAAIAAMDDAGSFVVRSIKRSSEGRSPWASAGIQQNLRAY